MNAVDEALWRRGEADCIGLYAILRRIGAITQAQEAGLIHLLTADAVDELDQESAEAFGELAMVEDDRRGLWQYAIERTRYVRELRRFLDDPASDRSELDRIGDVLRRYNTLIVGMMPEASAKGRRKTAAV